MKKGDIVKWCQPHSAYGRRVGLGMITATGDECGKRTPGWSAVQGKDRNDIIEILWSDGTLQKHLDDELELVLGT